jgi:branched-chain amino acid transport system permease protein
LTQFLQQLINGAVLGASYGLIALGYTMVYGIIRLINFAHGEIFMIGAFAGLTAWKALPDGMEDQAFIVLPLTMLVAVLVAVITALAMERLAYRPLRGASRLAPLITAIGVSIALQEAVRLFYPDAKQAVVFPRVLPDGGLDLGGVFLDYASLFLISVAVVLMVGLATFVRKTKLGKAMRATSQDPDTARLMGIDTNRVIVLTFALGATLAGIAGVLHGMRFKQIDFRMGFLAGLKAFSAAVLGGIGNITGAVVGGFLIGIVEAMATQYIPQGSRWKDVFAFAVLIGVLVFKPTGLLGQQERVRA